MAQGIAYSEKLSNGGTLIVNGDKWYIEYNIGGNIRIAPWQVKLYSSAMFEDIAQYPVLEPKRNWQHIRKTGSML